MQQSHIPSREQSDASLTKFFAVLGHRPPATLAFRANPRLSGRAVHTDLSSTVERMRARDIYGHPLPEDKFPDAPVVMSQARLQELEDAYLPAPRMAEPAERAMGLAMMAVSAVITLAIVVPAVLTVVARAL